MHDTLTGHRDRNDNHHSTTTTTLQLRILGKKQAPKFTTCKCPPFHLILHRAQSPLPMLLITVLMHLVWLILLVDAIFLAHGDIAMRYK